MLFRSAALTKVITANNECNYVLVDKFASTNDIEEKLKELFPWLNVIQQHRAEADIAVAAASILARAEFLTTMKSLADLVDAEELPKGGSDTATNFARTIVEKYGRKTLSLLVKMHFANYKKI